MVGNQKTNNEILQPLKPTPSAQSPENMSTTFGDTQSDNHFTPKLIEYDQMVGWCVFLFSFNFAFCISWITSEPAIERELFRICNLMPDVYFSIQFNFFLFPPITAYAIHSYQRKNEAGRTLWRCFVFFFWIFFSRCFFYLIINASSNFNLGIYDRNQLAMCTCIEFNTQLFRRLRSWDEKYFVSVNRLHGNDVWWWKQRKTTQLFQHDDEAADSENSSHLFSRDLNETTNNKRKTMIAHSTSATII